MGELIKILGFAGSLRKESYNRAQYHLRQMFVFLNMFPLNQPEVMIAHAKDKFDNEGNLKTRQPFRKSANYSRPSQTGRSCYRRRGR